VTFYGVKTYFDPSYIFSGLKTPNPYRIYVPEKRRSVIIWIKLYVDPQRLKDVYPVPCKFSDLVLPSPSSRKIFLAANTFGSDL